MPPAGPPPNTNRFLNACDSEDSPSKRKQIKLNAIVNHPGWCESLALPVVDSGDILQGKLRFMKLKQHDAGVLHKGVKQNLRKASSALGELYRLGLSSLMDGASEIYSRREKNL